MKSKIALLILSILVAICSLQAQVVQEWVAIYNGPGIGFDDAISIAVDGSGNVYVTGTSRGVGTGDDYATIKYSSAGVLLWEARFNGPGNDFDEAKSIVVDGTGNVYVTGTSIGISTSLDYATIKYSSSGVQQWVARYNGLASSSADIPSSIKFDGSGNVYVTGSSGSGADADYATIKYNSSGVQQWVERYNGTGNNADAASSLSVDNFGNVYVTGTSIGSGTSSDYVTIKYNSSGIQQWLTQYNGPGNDADFANSLSVDGSGNVYVTGSSIGSGTIYDYATIKYNSAGVQQWVVRYNGPGNNSDYASAMVIDNSGNVYVTGQSTGSGTNQDYVTIKYNSSGVQQWLARYNGPGNNADAAGSLALDGSGNVYVTGRSTGSGTMYDYATIKYNSSGVQQWVQTYNGPGNGNDDAISIAADTSGKVYVTGQSVGIGTFDDYATIKYSQPIGIHPISIEIPKSFSLSQNYPNPFNPSTKIKFDLPHVGQRHAFDVSLNVYNMLGEEIITLVNEQLNPGTYEVDFDGSNYSSGVYYYKIVVGDNTNNGVHGDYAETKKMVIIK